MAMRKEPIMRKNRRHETTKSLLDELLVLCARIDFTP